jgi:hypothetical protein
MTLKFVNRNDLIVNTYIYFIHNIYTSIFYFHTEHHKPSSSGSLLHAIKPKVFTSVPFF